MSNDPRPCCILGVCCPPGGAEQRADMKAWLLEKLKSARLAEYTKSGEGSLLAAEVDSWLDELPWEKAGE